MNRCFFLFLPCLLALGLAACQPEASNREGSALPAVKHLIIVGVDGLSPDGILQAETPAIDELMASGASSLHARGVMPTSSSPNWGSMICGAGPEQHGITANGWKPDSAKVKGTMTDAQGYFPSIFDLLRQQRPESTIGVVHDWSGFASLFQNASVDRIEDTPGPDTTMLVAIDYLRSEQPELTFIHLDHVDHAGHQEGHGTPAYYEAVTHADHLIGQLIEALKTEGLWASTHLIVTSDHGGVGKGHGGATMAELEIPWIIHGPGVLAGKQLATPINTYDTAATVAWLFGLTVPTAWIGKPVMDAFADMQ